MKTSISTETRLTSEVKKRALACGFDLVGITSAKSPPHAKEFQEWLKKKFHGKMEYMERNARRRIDPQEILPTAHSIVTVALNYFTGNEKQETRVARYAWGTCEYHTILWDRLDQLSRDIRAIGGTGTETKYYVDTGPILERDFAQRAGIGFVGKHTNLISRNLGNWLLLGEILTNLELISDEPEHKTYCGSCTQCIDICPTQAIVAPYQLDSRRCISYLTIELRGSIPINLRPLIGDHLFGCDDCLDACPWNRFAKIAQDQAFHRRELPSLTDLLSWDNATFRRFFVNTPILRIKRRGFLRNVCVVLGNIGDRSALPALTKSLEDIELLVREHAAWAIEQIQNRQTP